MSDIDLKLKRLQHQFRKWRATKTARSERIPKRLWTEARKLSAVLPARQVAQALGLDVRSLKPGQQILSSKKGRRLKLKKPKTGRFVAIDIKALNVQNSQPGVLKCEWVRGDGAKLIMELGETHFNHVMSSFLGGSH